MGGNGGSPSTSKDLFAAVAMWAKEANKSAVTIASMVFDTSSNVIEVTLEDGTQLQWITEPSEGKTIGFLSRLANQARWTWFAKR